MNMSMRGFSPLWASGLRWYCPFGRIQPFLLIYTVGTWVALPHSLLCDSWVDSRLYLGCESNWGWAESWLEIKRNMQWTFHWIKLRSWILAQYLGPSLSPFPLRVKDILAVPQIEKLNNLEGDSWEVGYSIFLGSLSTPIMVQAKNVKGPMCSPSRWLLCQFKN